MNNFKSVNPEELTDNMFKLISKDWTLIAAGDESSYNMMTANWAGIGFLWKKNVAFVFIRPTRYTYEFTEKLNEMTLNFFTEDYRDVLNICGAKSGRTFDKMKDVNLTPISTTNGGIAFSESRLILNCKKLATGNLADFDFIDEAPLAWYNGDEYHKMYICEITEAFIKE